MLESMTKKYDAMVDDNDAVNYYGAHDPVIIFRPEEVFREVKKVRKIKAGEMNKNEDGVIRELYKRA